MSTYRYRVEVEVRYEGHKAKFLFWDRECAELIGKTASEVKEIMIKVNLFTPYIIFLLLSSHGFLLIEELTSPSLHIARLVLLVYTNTLKYWMI
jgi:hypothetical protein